MNTSEGRAWHALAGIRGIGSQALWQLADYLERHEKPASWLFQEPERIRVALGSARIASMAAPAKPANGQAVLIGKKPLTVLHPFHPCFPASIKTLRERFPLPPVLYARGNLALLSRPAVAVVGKRNADERAKIAATALAQELAGLGINVVSGYAAGIDSTAHQAALRAGGTTSIILAEGIGHFQIKAEMSDFLTSKNTLVISQFEPRAKWAAYMAMTRNKLIAALSRVLVVIISGPERDARGKNSGTFNTALAAVKMGMPVFVAVSGSASEPAPGNLELIKKGCREWDPASGAAPIMAAMLPPASPRSTPRQLGLFEKN